MVDRGDRARAAGRGRRTSPPASRCSRSSPATADRRRGARRRHRRGPDTVCPPHRSLPARVGAADGRRELGLPAVHHRRPRRRASTGRDGVDVGLVEGVGRPALARSATTATTSTFAHALAPDLVVLVADAGLGTINAVRLSVAAFADFPVVVALNRFAADPLHARNRGHLVDARRLRRGHRTAASSRRASAYRREMSRRRHDLAAVLLAVTVVGTAVVLVSGFRVASPERAAGVGLACATLATVVLVPGFGARSRCRWSSPRRSSSSPSPSPPRRQRRTISTPTRWTAASSRTTATAPTRTRRPTTRTIHSSERSHAGGGTRRRSTGPRSPPRPRASRRWPAPMSSPTDWASNCSPPRACSRCCCCCTAAHATRSWSRSSAATPSCSSRW